MSAVHAADPVFVTDGRMRIVEWSHAAESFTGIEPSAAVGRPCWAVIRGRAEDGRPGCGPTCTVERTVSDGWDVGCRRLTVSFPSGRTSVALSVATLEGGQAAVLHRMLDLGPGGNGAAAPRLTRRQSQVLHLLADGVRVREIARRLVLAEPTVRNHVHAILVELGVHSQIEAVARARELGLLRLAD